MKIVINDNSAEPIYYQIYQQIKEQIDNNKIIPGEQLPTERELNRSLRVSRITIRKAIKDLVLEGFCYKKRGKGIFVSGGKIPLELDNLMGMANHIRSLKLELNTKVILKRVIKANVRLAEKLEVEKKSKVLYLKRLRIIKNEPLVIENTYLSLNRLQGLEKYNFEGSLYKIIRENYNLFPHHSRGTIIHKLADEENAKLLNIPLNYSLTEKQAVVYDKNNTPIEFVKNYYLSNRFIFFYNSFFRKIR
ncbi:MAG: GntR family transcriptional regulator [Candidatus Helarchaeota archaeon]